MKITKEHIGKKIRRKCWREGVFFIPLFVGETHVFGRSSYPDQPGSEDMELVDNDWDLFVLPSERIEQLIGPTRDDVDYAERRVEAIVKFLDEQTAKK